MAVNVMAIVLLFQMMLGAATPARAGHTIQSGDCWRTGTPLLCRTTWNSTSRVVDLRLYDQFSGVRSGWLSNAETACNNWHNYRLQSTNDIWCHWAPLAGASAVYLKTGTNGNFGLGSMITAITWNCNSSGFCDSSGLAMNIWYSEIYFNVSGPMDSLSSARRTNVFAHEMGHTLGLYHHSTSSYLMYPVDTTVQGPTAGDYGSVPACSGASSTYGVRCVFGFSN